MTQDPATPRVNDTGTAGVIARPPVLFLASGLLGQAADHLQPVAFPVPAGDAIHRIIGCSLIVIGLAIAVSGIRGFASAGTPVPTNQPTRALVTNGTHSWSRNPIYVGMFLIYGGIGVAAQSVWILVLALPLAITIRYGVVAREEAYLEWRFGEAYLNYKARVRRWL
jgi:protein-S-isoprenylcysteine O-methyltransferase Ste14